MAYNSLDIILPCYNPPKGWVDSVIASYNDISRVLAGVDIGIIVVNDGSNIGVSKEDISRLQSAVNDFRYIHYKDNQGKGYALRKGVTISSREVQIYTDIDFPYQENNIVDFFHILKNETVAIVVGIRDSNYYNNIPKTRIWISKILRFVIKMSLKIPTSDTQAGLKGI